MKDRSRLVFKMQAALSVAVTLTVLLPLFLADMPWPRHARDYMEVFGEKESGAINMVSAIYLGYRAFDTLGETIILLLAVSGTIGIILKPGENPGRTASGSETSASKSVRLKKRTNLLAVVSGKIAPVVLLFGVYVMLYGHLSPGGGFQGGVVIASGIFFLALGRKPGVRSLLSDTSVLYRIEASTFLLLLLASAAGIFLGEGFFANPMGHFGIAPVGFILVLNVIIGLKVGAGIGLMCIIMLGKSEE